MLAGCEHWRVITPMNCGFESVKPVSSKMLAYLA